MDHTSVTQIDILHPRAILEWSECKECPICEESAKAVWVKDKLYVGGGETPQSYKDDARLCIYTPTTDTWDTLDTPVCWFALTTFRSKLVLIGGLLCAGEGTGSFTNKVWTLTEQNQLLESLPPMKVERHSASAVSHGDCLLVAGGYNPRKMTLDTVEVYNGNGLWFLAQCLPKPYWDVKSVVLDGHWYLIGGYEQGVEVICASICDLIKTTCYPQPTEILPSSLWARLPDVPHHHSSPCVIGDRLIAIGGEMRGSEERQGKQSMPVSNIHAYSSQSQSWIHVEDTPISVSKTCATVLPTGKLVVVGGEDKDFKHSNKVFKAVIKVASYDSQFTFSALRRVETAGVPLMNSLRDDDICLLQSTLGIDSSFFTGDNNMDFTVDSWLGGLSHVAPTWKNLLLILRLINLDFIAKQIKSSLTITTRSIEKQSEKSSALVAPDPDIKPYFQISDALATLREEYDCKINMLKAQNEQLVSRLELASIDIATNSEPKEETVISKATSALATAAWDLCGVEVCGEMSVEIYSSHYQQIIWEGFGLKLHIHKGCLPAGMEQCIVHIKASLAGQYEFPGNSQLVSAIFWIRCDAVHKFLRPITVEIQHCARLENVTSLNLTFVRAVCSQKHLPYTFKQIGGEFTSHSSYGIIELNRFSGIGITQEGSEDREYCSRLFYLGQEMITIYFIVVWNTEVHLNFVEKHYASKGALPGPDQTIDFEREEIKLDIPMKGVRAKGGWVITPLIPPVIMKKDVDKYKPGKRIPSCHLIAKMSKRKKNTFPDLICHVKLLGARSPRDEFIIYICPDQQTTSRSLTFGDLVRAGTYCTTTDATPPVERSQSFGGSPAIATGPPPNKKSRSESDIQVKGLLQPPASSSEQGFLSRPMKPELRDLVKELYSTASDKWEDIGILIGIEPNVLDSIKKTENHTAQSCLREMLKIWLKRVTPSPSWSAIAEAIELLGDQNLAGHLRTKYQVIQVPY